MKQRIKFRPLDGIWSKFYDIDDIPKQFNTMEFDAVIIEEEMTKEQYKEYMASFNQ